MNRFAVLFQSLDGTTSSTARTLALAAYLREAPEPDRLWTIALLTGRRPRRVITAGKLAEWAAEAAGIPDWLFAESYSVAGDLAETIAAILPPAETTTNRSLSDWIATLRALSAQDEPARRAGILAAWAGLDATERLLFNKLLTGGFRMGVARGLMQRALAQATGLDEATLAHRLMGDWSPDTTTFAALITGDGAQASRPYPFCLAHPLDADPDALGDPADWLAEWKWDGIRGQLVCRDGRVFLWSRGEELVTDRYPEIVAAAQALPEGTVLDGEILGWAGAPLPFATLQRRIGLKTVSRRTLAEVPVIFMAYDLLEADSTDLRPQPFATRRAALEALASDLPPELPLSPLARFDDWATLAAHRQAARDRGAEGVMLKQRTSPYHAGRKRGDWWKWKLDPFSLDAVLIYAQAGHGRRAGLYTDFTFALWDGPALVPVAKAYSGLTDAEFAEITRWVRAHTTDRFGPVRQVVPELVFELGFEGIAESPRHKSGLALRFPRMLRWRRDKPAAEADRIETARALLAHPAPRAYL